MSHQIGNRRFTATRFRKPGPERVTQIVPMQILNPCEFASRSERRLEVGVRLGSIGIDENVTAAANSASYLSQRAPDVFVHRYGVIPSRL